MVYLDVHSGRLVPRGLPAVEPIDAGKVVIAVKHGWDALSLGEKIGTSVGRRNLRHIGVRRSHIVDTSMQRQVSKADQPNRESFAQAARRGVKTAGGRGRGQTPRLNCV